MFISLRAARSSCFGGVRLLHEALGNLAFPRDALVDRAEHHPPLHAIEDGADASISLYYPLVIYTAVLKNLNGSLEYSGDSVAWERTVSHRQVRIWQMDHSDRPCRISEPQFHHVGPLTRSNLWSNLTENFDLFQPSLGAGDRALCKTITLPLPNERPPYL